MLSISHSLDRAPKREIQEKVKAFAHAAADVSKTGIASTHLNV
jgi:hypothetical protein